MAGSLGVRDPLVSGATQFMGEVSFNTSQSFRPPWVPVTIRNRGRYGIWVPARKTD